MTVITKEQHALLHPYLPVQRGNVRISNLAVINAILYVTANGGKWWSLPPHFGWWHTVHRRLRRWTDAGALQRLLAALLEHSLSTSIQGWIWSKFSAA